MKKLYKCLSVTSALMLLFASMALAQQRVVTGVVKDEGGTGMPGVNVLIKGTAEGTATDVDGNYSIAVPGDESVIVFSFVGYTSQEITVGPRTSIDISMQPDVTTLQELVVTGYMVEKKADIIGSVAVINNKDLLATPAANLTSQLQGRAPGVVVSGGGEPGAAAKVRIRGFTSFGSSDPLYVIDGVPTRDASRVNPNDIESIQVLKDATSASIYGARAAQGVIIITTKQGTPGTMNITYDGYVGGSYIPESTFPDLLDTSGYLEYLNRINDPNAAAPYTHPLFGTVGSFEIPDYMVVSRNLKGGFYEGDPEVDPSLYSVPRDDYSNIYQIARVSRGTNWFDEVTRTGIIQNHQLSASGGTEKNTYSVGLNYFNEQGTYVYSGYKRYALRMNSSFKPTKFFRFGENLQLIHEDHQNAVGNTVRGEASAWAQAFRMVPYIPVYDIMGGWGGNGIGDSGNGTNPVAQLARDADDIRRNYKILGNVYAELEPVKNLVFRTSFGVDYGNFFTKDIVKRTYERAENTQTTGLGVFYNYNVGWTWTNTLTYGLTLGDHNLKFLGGTEAIRYSGDGISTSANQFDFEDPLFINLNTDLGASAGTGSIQPTVYTLASYFGRLDYGFNDKYLFNATIRRDGSSKFGPENRYGVFPAFGVGWRLSSEPFMQGITALSNFMLRAGWGQMGSDLNVSAENSFSTFGTHPGLANYDINRTQNSLAVGYAARRFGSTATRWETTESTNIGFDASFHEGRFDLTFNYFNTDTKDLLVGRQRFPTEGFGSLPAINLGKMRNTGFEFGATTRGTLAGDLQYDVNVNFTHYKNTAIDLDGNPLTFFSRNASRLNNVARTQAGHPISSFHGYQIDGFFQSQAEIDALDQPGAVVGSWRYKDLNSDGIINDDDKTFIGNPQPDFIMGINVGFRYRNFDFSTFLVWNYGNELFNYTKYFTEMRVFVGGVSERVLTEGWTPEKPSGALPYLAPGAENGYTPFIRSTPSDYYVEDGSYLRGRTFQIGYNVPASLANRLALQKARLYFQGQNYFTITNYTGADPDINIQGSDLFMGVDQTSYPNSRQFLLGLNLTF
jgi:TonB-linked SusC/RagA family outer membrane protein